MHVPFILLLIFKCWVLADCSNFATDARNLKWSLTDEYVITVDNVGKYYEIRNLSASVVYSMPYLYQELEVYSLRALTMRLENTSSAFVQTAKNTTSKPYDT